jgi:hypothetical protein
MQVTTKTRKVTYSISAFATLFFFLFPEPQIAVVGALMIQTLAFLVIAGKSPVDGFLLCGISLLLVGLLPSSHPLVAGSETYANARWPLIIAACSIIAIAGITVAASGRKKTHANR